MNFFFYGHSLSTAASSRAVVNYWRKDEHLVLINRLAACQGTVCLVYLTVAPMYEP